MKRSKRSKRRRSRGKISLEKNILLKSVLIPLICLLLATGGYIVWGVRQDMGTLEGLDYIHSFVGSGGRLNDFQNKLGMNDPKEDIKWFHDENGIRIEFGRIVLDFTEEEFYNESTVEKLRDIGITHELKGKADNKTLKLYYLGQELEEYSR